MDGGRYPSAALLSLLHFWLKLGTSEARCAPYRRWPEHSRPLAYGVAVCCSIGRWLGGAAVGLVSLSRVYSQEARMYALWPCSRPAQPSVC